MEKQKICIVGGSLTGLVTAISLSKLNCKIDLIVGNYIQNTKSNRTIALSENNLNFLSNLNISKTLKKEMWNCSEMKLYAEIKNKKFSQIFEFNNKKKEEKILYMLQNSEAMKLMMNKIRQIKCITIKNHTKVTSIETSKLLKIVKFNNNISKYNLVIICTGYNSDLIKNIFNYKLIKKSYNETAITTILSHSSFENTTVRQIFLENEILALLPISNTKTSIVWTVKNEIKKMNNNFLKKSIKLYAENYLKNIKFQTNIELKDLNFLVRNKYYSDRTLLFGDALHHIHPFLGQGFNMTLRDLACLEKILVQKINLGLDIGSPDVLSEFSKEAKPRNFAFSVGSDLIKKSLSFKVVRNDIFKILNKSSLAKDILFNIADRGFRF